MSNCQIPPLCRANSAVRTPCFTVWAVTAERRSQVGTGMRNERIRTYNFPQGRLTDHRIGLTLYRLESVMDGDLDEIIDALVTADQAERLRAREQDG